VPAQGWIDVVSHSSNRLDLILAGEQPAGIRRLPQGAAAKYRGRTLTDSLQIVDAVEFDRGLRLAVLPEPAAISSPAQYLCGKATGTTGHVPMLRTPRGAMLVLRCMLLAHRSLPAR
jgi:hypothetical protein